MSHPGMDATRTSQMNMVWMLVVARLARQTGRRHTKATAPILKGMLAAHAVHAIKKSEILNRFGDRFV